MRWGLGEKFGVVFSFAVVVTATESALSTWKKPSLPCKHTSCWFKTAILTTSRAWKTKLNPSPHKFPHLKSNYFSTKPPRRHNAPPPPPTPPPPPPPPPTPHNTPPPPP